MRRDLVLLSFGLYALSSLLLAGCDSKAQSATEAKPPEVYVANPVQKDVWDYAEFTGTVKSADVVEIRARVKGFLEKVEYPEGEVISKDKPMFRIEKDIYVANLASAKAQKKRTEAALKLAEANLARYKKLFEKGDGVVTIEEVQTREAERDAAAATILFDDATIKQAEIELGYTQINAPITGLTGTSLVDPGNLVGSTGDTLLTTIRRMDLMYVDFDVSDEVVQQYLAHRRRHAGEKREGGSMFIGLRDEEGFPHEGKVVLVDNKISTETGTALVRGEFKNRQGFLYPGQYARVRLPVAQLKDAILIEDDAVGTDLDGKYVFVVDEKNIVHQRSVVLGSMSGDKRVVLSGLKANERYITRGIQYARPGQPVTPKTEDEATNGNEDSAGESKTEDDAE